MSASSRKSSIGFYIYIHDYMLDNSVKLSFCPGFHWTVFVDFFSFDSCTFPASTQFKFKQKCVFLGCIAKKLASKSGFAPVARIIERTSNI